MEEHRIRFARAASWSFMSIGESGGDSASASDVGGVQKASKMLCGNGILNLCCCFFFSIEKRALLNGFLFGRKPK